MVVSLSALRTDGMGRDDFLLFSETPGRFVVTVSSSAAPAFEGLMGAAASRIGQVSEDRQLVVTGLSGEVIIDVAIGELKSAWQRPLDF